MSLNQAWGLRVNGENQLVGGALERHAELTDIRDFDAALLGETDSRVEAGADRSTADGEQVEAR